MPEQQLQFFVFVYFVLAGLCVGSFLNVVIYRLPKPDMSIVRPGSFCPVCLTPIRWYDNIPIVSYLLLFQKCRVCRTYIPLRYPLVEALTGLLFGWIAWRSLLGEPVAMSLYALTAVKCMLAAALVAVSFIDIDLRIIPDEISVWGMYLTPLISLLVPVLHADFPDLPWYAGSPHAKALVSSIFGIIVGLGSLRLVGLLGKALFRKEAMGMGDVKLMGLVGGLLGWNGVLSTICLAALLGSVYGIGRLLLRRDHYLPFGPFLAGGAIVTLLYKAELMRFITTTYPNWFYRVMYH